MIKFTGTNVKVHSVSEVINIESKTGGQPYQKRELVIDDSWDKDGKHYANFVLIEFSGEKMAQLDQLVPGMRINVEGVINGREHNGRIFDTVKGLAAYVPVQTQQPQQPYQSAPMPGSYPQQGYGQPQGYQQGYGQQAPQGYTPQPQRQPAMTPEQYPTYNTAPNYMPQQNGFGPGNGYPQR